MVETSPLSLSHRLRFDRPTALAFAVFANAMLLGALALPSNTPFHFPPAIDSEEPPIIADFVPLVKTPLPPIPDLPQPPVRAQPTPPAAPVTAPVATIESTPMSTAVPVAPIAAVSDVTDTHPPVSIAAAPTAVSYRFAPAPIYPTISHRRQHQGTVVLRVLVGRNGIAQDVQVEESSGYSELDQAARNQVLRRWEFIAAQQNGSPIQAWVRVPIDFKLLR